MRRIVSLSLVCFAALQSTAHAYGPNGHQIVGQIADEQLANTPAGKQIYSLIDGFTLEKTAVIPDEIKGWDKKGVDDPNNFPSYSTHPKIAAQLRDFWRANQPTHDTTSPNPSHHWFHYTDVPVSATKYEEGHPGTSKWDVVHMIGFCVDVLQGKIPENNERKITKPLAVILLTHYVGDIHQPLHVGAEYFTQTGQIDDPEKDKNAIPDEGGNTLEFRLLNDPPQGKLSHSKKLHGYWDGDTVDSLLPAVGPGAPKEQRWSIQDPARRKLGQDMAKQEPKDWKLPPGTPLDRAGYVWATEILPIAKEAHDRLSFNNVHPVTQDEGGPLATGEARERQTSDKKSYKDWSAEVVRMELHKAGWRLADLLTRAVSSPADAGTGGPEPSASSAKAEEAPNNPPGSILHEATPSPSVTPSSAYGTYPANYKDIINAWMSANAPQDAAHVEWQADPAPSDLPTAQGRHVYGYLVIFNSRSGIGGKGKTHSALIRYGKVVSVSGFGP